MHLGMTARVHVRFEDEVVLGMVVRVRVGMVVVVVMMVVVVVMGGLLQLLHDGVP